MLRSSRRIAPHSARPSLPTSHHPAFALLGGEGSYGHDGVPASTLGTPIRQGLLIRRVSHVPRLHMYQAAPPPRLRVFFRWSCSPSASPHNDMLSKTWHTIASVRLQAMHCCDGVAARVAHCQSESKAGLDWAGFGFGSGLRLACPVEERASGLAAGGH